MSEQRSCFVFFLSDRELPYCSPETPAHKKCTSKPIDFISRIRKSAGPDRLLKERRPLRAKTNMSLSDISEVNPTQTDGLIFTSYFCFVICAGSSARRRMPTDHTLAFGGAALKKCAVTRCVFVFAPGSWRTNARTRCVRRRVGSVIALRASAALRLFRP